MLHRKDTKKRSCPFPPLHTSELVHDDLYFMIHAYNEARRAWELDEVPVGAVVEFAGSIIAKAHNQVEQLKDPTAHAEILAISQAAAHIGDWRLNEATLYVTKEPCPMCAGASIMARLKRVVFAIPDPKLGCLGGATALHTIPSFYHSLEVSIGILETPCRELLQAFFQEKRL
ncbi:MAG: nucleoside deaminase [Methylacidiphilales bacterium]|nr:nucleoside deaminase [Candidatus Methylacidiphilales bacterium]MDW8349363.1 nucleoside deaminase [Verrucomicrobiae bacterium]